MELVEGSQETLVGNGNAVDRAWLRFKQSSVYGPVTDFLADHRGTIAASTMLPASFVYDRAMALRSWYREELKPAPELHDQRVAEVQAQVREWKASGSSRPMCTARPGFATMGVRRSSYKKDCSRISVNLRDILSLDEARGVVRVEPLVNMGQLTRFLNPRGWALANMTEMDDLTVGGLCMGLGMSTSSHKFGLTQETVEAFEVVLADGRLVRATATENTDLFRALPWSHGTLGFLVAAELKVVRVKKYIHLDYLPCHSREELRAKLDALACADDTPDVLEATIYSKEESVIMAGRFSDGEDETPVNPVNRWYKPWFYRHVQGFLSGGPTSELIPLRQYYHRHTRSIFWELHNIIPFCDHPAYRYLLGWMGAPKVSLLKLTLTPELRREMITKHVAQDIIIPLDELPESVERFERWFDVYPLLVYPIRIFDHGEQSFLKPPVKNRPGKGWQMYFDLGVYGVPGKVMRGEPWDGVAMVREMEQYARDVGGYQCLYADTFMNEAEFEQMFSLGHYRKMREKYGAVGAFPEVWKKVQRQF